MTTKPVSGRAIAWLSALSGLWLAAGCATPIAPDADGPPPRFHNWWAYYERATARRDAGNFAGARNDFERCLALRPGATFGMDEEQWRIRTYGLHFINGYFPNRELGVCWYELGDLARAEHFLARSLEKEPSGRATFYLNLARAARLQASAVKPPLIQIDAACLPALTRERVRRLSGVASGEGFVSDVWINGARLFMELATTNLAFRKDVALAAGSNEIVVAIRDLKGQRAERRLAWTADWSPPGIAVTAVHRTADGWLATAVCHDDLGLASVDVLNAVLPAAHPDGARDVTLSVPIGAGPPPVIRARDQAGNEIDATLSPLALGLAASARRDVQWAQAAAPASDAPAAAPLPTAGAARATDRLPPSVAHVPTVLSAVSGDAFYLDGEARDPGGLASITIEGEEQLPGSCHGPLVYRFARSLPLRPRQTNAFTVAATDLAGNTTQKGFSVVQRAPDSLNVSLRLPASVTPVVEPEGRTDGQLVRAFFQEELSAEPVRFNLLARDQADWDRILTEQKFSRSALANPAAALRLRRGIPAELLLVVESQPTGGGLTLYCRAISAADGHLVKQTDAYGESRPLDFRELTARLSFKLKQLFPLVESQVESVRDNRVTIGAGAASGVESGMRFYVISPPPAAQDPSGGFVRKAPDGQPLQVCIEETAGGRAVGALVPAGAGSAIGNGDMVIAR